MMEMVRLEDMEANGWAPPLGEPVAPPTPVPVFWHGDRTDKLSTRSIIKGLLPAQGVGLLAGQSGAGKTFVGIDLGGALATATPFFGRPIRRGGGTLILAAEAVGTIGERIEAMMLGRGIEAEQLPIAWREVSGLSDPTRLAALLAEVEAIGAEMQDRLGVPLTLIVVDTIAAAFGFDDENAAAEATKAMLALQHIGAAAEAFALGVAHYGKTAETGVRGSSAFTASADVILSCLAERDINGKVTSRTLALTKSRRAATGWNCPFELQSVDLGEDEDGDPLDSCSVVPALAEARDSPAPKAGGGLTKSGKVFVDALKTVLGDKGVKIRPFGMEGPFVWVADFEDVRSEFYSRWPANGEDEKKRNAARRQQLSRGAESAVAANVVHVREIDGIQKVWLIQSETATGRSA